MYKNVANVGLNIHKVFTAISGYSLRKAAHVLMLTEKALNPSISTTEALLDIFFAVHNFRNGMTSSTA